MENKYRRKKEPEENRELILKAAIQIITENGLGELTIGAVAKKAKMTKGGVVHHFPRKDVLIDEVFRGRLDQFTEMFEQELKFSGKSRAMAYLLAAFKYEPTEEHKILLKVIFQTLLQHNQYRTLYQTWYNENIAPDLDKASVVDSMAILLADGLLLSYLTGTSIVSALQKQKIHEFLNKEIL